MTLVEKQGKFTEAFSRFTLALIAIGYTVTDGEAYRTEAQAKIYEAEGKGISNSLHCLRLARDINLFKDGVMMKTVADYKLAGEVWEHYTTQDNTCCWGGRFSRPDANHFSFYYNGVR